MRPLLCAAVVLASGLTVGIFVPSGAASTSTPGDGCLVVKSGFGNVSITLTRGVVFGRVQSAASIITDDTVGADGLPPPRVVGADNKKVLPDGRVRYTNNSTTPGSSMRFRSTGAVKITIMQATFLDLSIVGKGVAVLSNGGLTGATNNQYSADAASFCQDAFLPLTLKPIKVSISSPES
jgi:hypothetical protein